MNAIRNSLAAVRNHTREFGPFTLVYPVISRRARGLSLGVNLNPDKVCNFNCLYCEVDRTTPGRPGSVDPERLRQELTALIQYIQDERLHTHSRFAEAPTLAREIKDIAFSGDGEPTLIPNFHACVQVVAEVKKQAGLDRTKIVLITDAAGLDKADVRRGLEVMDAHQGEIWGKLDAGTEPYFRLVNRTTIRFDRILANLLETARIRPIVIQSLFLNVHGQPMPPAELDAYCQRLQDLLHAGGRIKEVHAYTVARPTPETFATKLDETELASIATRIREQTRLPVHVFP